jgi:hypothetical protein
MAIQVGRAFDVRLANPSLQPTRYGPRPQRAAELERLAAVPLL